jgi:hypothetical protein
MPGRQIAKVLFFESSACGQKRETEGMHVAYSDLHRRRCRRPYHQEITVMRSRFSSARHCSSRVSHADCCGQILSIVRIRFFGACAFWNPLQAGVSELA